MPPLLNRDLRNAGERLTLFLKRGRIANHKDLRMLGHGEVALNVHSSGTVGLDLQPLAGRRRRDTGCPDHGLARDAFAGNHHTISIDLIDTVSEPDLDPQPLESLLRSLGKML